MSETKELVKVDNPVTIVWAHDFQAIGLEQQFDFNLRLHTRGSDFTVYANTGYAENTKDAKLLSAIIRAVMTIDSGIERIDVKAFELKINANRASDPKNIAKQLQYAAERAGYGVTFRDESGRH
ncbi:MAG TPA: hypothetical protein VF281_00110 [Candidatus Saccharimonadales bacterium]